MPQMYSVELQFLINRLLEKNPEQRPSARQVLSYPAVAVRCELMRMKQAEQDTQRQLKMARDNERDALVIFVWRGDRSEN